MSPPMTERALPSKSACEFPIRRDPQLQRETDEVTARIDRRFEKRTAMTDDTSLVTRIHIEGGSYVRASEGIDNVAERITAASMGDGWAVFQDPGTALEKYVLASRVLWLEQEENGD